MITAHRNATLARAAGVIAGSSRQNWRSRANPPGSREQIMFRASLRFFPPVSS
jgi:hypothetical protein